MNECRDAFEKCRDYIMEAHFTDNEGDVNWEAVQIGFEIAWQARQKEIDQLLQTMDIQTVALRDEQLEIAQLVVALEEVAYHGSGDMQEVALEALAKYREARDA